MIGKVEESKIFTTQELCDPSIDRIRQILTKKSFVEQDIQELDRNIRHLQLFDYTPANQAISDGLAVLATYNS